MFHPSIYIVVYYNNLLKHRPAAKETLNIALAPNLDLFFVPSNSINILSIETWSVVSQPVSASNMAPLTLLTAFKTDLPIYFLPPSLNSQASCFPVEAPDGTDARPIILFSRITSVSIVGKPLFSNIANIC